MTAGNRIPFSDFGIVTGIAAEARLARRLSRRVACAGSDSGRVEGLALSLIEDGAKALMSFGIAGSLVADLRPGALVVADRVLTADGGYPAASDIASSIGARVGPIYGDLEISSQPADKKSIHERTSALAVDLESGGTARVAATAGVPFIAIRAIADPAWRGLPEAALLPLDAQGRPRLPAVFGSILAKPGQIPGLVMVALDTRAALASLLRACRVLAV